MKPFTLAFALVGLATLTGCAPSDRESASDAAAAVRSAIESVEIAPKVAERQDGWPEIQFDGGAAVVSELKAQPSGYRYTLEVSAVTRAACYGALSMTYPGATSLTLNGAAQDPIKLVPRGTPRDRVDPPGVLCSVASLPATVVAVRETDGKGPVKDVLGGWFTYRDTN